MPQSTTTLIELVNRVLLDVGERIVTVLSSPAARKATEYCKEAFLDVQTFHDWSWQLDFFTATSWDNEKAVFDNIKRIRSMQFDNDRKRINVPYIDPPNFYESQELTSFTDNSAVPCNFTIIQEDTVALNPYPTDTAGQVRVKIYGYRNFPAPTLPDEVFDLPEYFIPLVTKRAVYMMLVRHLGELNEADALSLEFVTKLNFMKTQDKATTTRGLNMYKNLRAINYARGTY